MDQELLPLPPLPAPGARPGGAASPLGLARGLPRPRPTPLPHAGYAGEPRAVVPVGRPVWTALAVRGEVRGRSTGLASFVTAPAWEAYLGAGRAGVKGRDARPAGRTGARTGQGSRPPPSCPGPDKGSLSVKGWLCPGPWPTGGVWMTLWWPLGLPSSWARPSPTASRKKPQATGGGVASGQRPWTRFLQGEDPGPSQLGFWEPATGHQPP